MSDFKVQGEGPPGGGHGGHEGTDLALGPIVGFGIGLVVMAAFVYVVLGWFMAQFVKDSKRSQALKPALFADERGQFPPPKNQKSPYAELAEHRLREREQLESYGWIDREKGVARVPIERAMEIVAERGLPPSKNIAPKGARGATQP